MYELLLIAGLSLLCNTKDVASSNSGLSMQNACRLRYSNELCEDPSILEAFGEATAVGVNKIVAEGIFDALNQQVQLSSTTSAVSYGHVYSPVSWLCDSTLMKPHAGKQAGTFNPGTTCSEVTSNIRSLIQQAKSKDLDMKRRVQTVHAKLINSNKEASGYSIMRRKVMGVRDTANKEKAAIDARKSTLERQIGSLNNEVRDLQQRIKRDGFGNWWRNLFGLRDYKQQQLQLKVNTLRNLHAEAVAASVSVHRYQADINLLTSIINQIKTHISRYEKYTKSLGSHITDLRNIENQLGMIAMQWSVLDEKCAAVEDDPFIFEDLVADVNAKVSKQAKQLAAIICNDAHIPALPTVKPFQEVQVVRASIGDCFSRYTPWNHMKDGDMVYLDRHWVSCNQQPMSMFHMQRSGSNVRYQSSCCSVSGPTTVSSGAVYTKYSGFSSDGDGKFVYLDRHSVNCGHNGFITFFKLQRDSGHSYVRYHYTCLSLNGVWKDRSVCYDSATAWSADGGGDAYYLDRQTVRCSNGYALSYFRLQRDNSHSYVQYRFRCCKVV